jgi:hypothetical protein
MLQILFKSSQAVTDPTSNYNNNRKPQQEERTGLWADQITLMDDVLEVCYAELPEILLVVVLAYILGVREGWSFTSTCYFAIMSASTTGYGEYTPKTQADKLYCIFFLPLSVAVFGEVLGRIASVFIRRRVRRAERKFLHRSITLCDLRKMDTNQDGQVDMVEFMTCKLGTLFVLLPGKMSVPCVFVFFSCSPVVYHIVMLVALQYVEQETLDDLKAIFNVLDVNGNGLLEKEDLLELNKKAKLKDILPVIEENSSKPFPVEEIPAM